MKIKLLSLLLIVSGIANAQTHPTASFTATTPCLGDASSFINGSIAAPGDPIASWVWKFPGGVPSTSATQNPVITFTAAGTHTVTLKVTSLGGYIDTISKQVNVSALPVANFFGSAAGCAPACVPNFTDLSTGSGSSIISWNWRFQGGSPSSSTQENPSMVCYNSPGSYGASLTVTTANGCKDSAVINPVVNVYPWPTANFTYSVTGSTVTCTNTSSTIVTQSAWNFGDGSPLDTNKSPTHTYIYGNTYFICLDVQTQHGCTDSLCKSILVSSVNENYLEDLFTIYPNPGNGIFTIRSTEKISIIEIKNVLGEKVYAHSFANSPIDLSAQPNGIYFLQLKTRNGIATKKIVVQR